MCEEVDVLVCGEGAERALLAQKAQVAEATRAREERMAAADSFEASLDPATEEWCDKIRDLVGWQPQADDVPQPAPLISTPDWGAMNAHYNTKY